MSDDLPDELRRLIDELHAADRDAAGLVEGLSDEQGTKRLAPDAWSVAECLDHLAVANRVYLGAMSGPAREARSRGRTRLRAAQPGWPGRLFIYTLEPPPKWWSRLKAPRKIRPRASPSLADAYARFLESQAAARDFTSENADLDLAGIRFPNPFVPGVRFSLATGLHVIPAHDRRHLLQAWKVRNALHGRSDEVTPRRSRAPD